MSYLTSIHDVLVPALLSPIHPYLPFGPIDIIGAMRLSSVVDWMARGIFDPPPPLAQESSEAVKLLEKGDSRSALRLLERRKERAGALQECFGILVVVFGGETFLGMWFCCLRIILYWIVLVS